MIEFHAPFKHLTQKNVLHIIVQAPFDWHKLVAPKALGHVRSTTEKIFDDLPTKVLTPFSFSCIMRAIR
jgi:hypothetical protein